MHGLLASASRAVLVANATRRSAYVGSKTGVAANLAYSTPHINAITTDTALDLIAAASNLRRAGERVGDALGVLCVKVAALLADLAPDLRTVAVAAKRRRGGPNFTGADSSGKCSQDNRKNKSRYGRCHLD